MVKRRQSDLITGVASRTVIDGSVWAQLIFIISAHAAATRDDNSGIERLTNRADSLNDGKRLAVLRGLGM